MRLSEHDGICNEAKAQQEHAANLYRSAKTELEAKELELHRAPAHNEALAEGIAVAELDGLDMPEAQPIDVAALGRQVAVLRTRTTTFEKGMRDASARLANLAGGREHAYLNAFRAKAESMLPQANKSLRRARPSLHDFGDVKLEQLWAAYLLTQGGRVSPNPNNFGEFMGSLFAMPDVATDWPDIRDAAIVWHERKTGTQSKEKAA